MELRRLLDPFWSILESLAVRDLDILACGGSGEVDEGSLLGGCLRVGAAADVKADISPEGGLLRKEILLSVLLLAHNLPVPLVVGVLHLPKDLVLSVFPKEENSEF